MKEGKSIFQMHRIEIPMAKCELKILFDLKSENEDVSKVITPIMNTNLFVIKEEAKSLKIGIIKMIERIIKTPAKNLLK